MKYQTLALNCECGARTTRIRDVGFTADHQLILHWLCSQCKRHVYAVKPLAECWRDCPTEDDFREQASAVRHESPANDADFLHTLGIKWPESVS